MSNASFQWLPVAIAPSPFILLLRLFNYQGTNQLLTGFSCTKTHPWTGYVSHQSSAPFTTDCKTFPHFVMIRDSSSDF